MINFIFRQLPNNYIAIFYSMFIVYLCAKPSPDLPDGIDDKMAHLLAFSGIGFLYYFLFIKKIRSILVGMFFGLAIELMQWILPESFNRSFDLIDVLYDTFGVLIGTLIAYGFYSFQKFRAKPS